MRTYLALLTLACVSLFATVAGAQDSVSKLNGVPGDAIDPHDAAEQINDYVVDLASFRSSWDRTFALAPIAKASQQRTSFPIFFTCLVNAQSLSRRVAPASAFLRSSYSHWNAPGGGVNNSPLKNDPGTLLPATGLTGFQIGFAFAEFGDGDQAGPAPAALGHVTGGIANFTLSSPSRLYVSRITAATNSPSDGCGSGSFGFGAVDEFGNLDFRADPFLASVPLNCPGFMGFTGNNLFRVDMGARAATVNTLASSFPLGADAAATTWMLQNSSVTHNCPNLVPASVPGGPLLIGTNFSSQYVYGSTQANLANGAAGAHLGGAADHKGAVSYATRNFAGLFPGSASGTAAIISGPIGTGSLRQNASIWGIDGTGNFVAPITRAVPVPAAGLDPDQPAWTPSGDHEFYHYFSQTFAQGGSGQIAVGSDQAGNLLVGGVVHYGFTATPGTNPALSNSNNYIALARIDPTSGVTSWTAAAWTETATTSGKNIYQNGTTVIGNLRPGTGITGIPGPCLSTPMIDSVGNVWFIGSYELSSATGTVKNGLFRAVLDPALFSYKLELVLEQGAVFAGRNSGRNYRVNVLPLNDSNSIGSHTAYSGNIAEDAHLGQPTVGLTTDDARTLGGVVIGASIIYDNNNDGQYVINLAPGPNPPAGTHIGPDEDYSVLLYIAASADCDANGIPDDREIADNLVPDQNANGIPDGCEGTVGVVMCAGDSVGATCLGCNNNGATGHGCANFVFAAGARLTSSGFATTTADTLVLTCSNMPGPGLFFQSNGLIPPMTFGDGMLCAAIGIIGMGVVFPTGGSASYPGGLTPNPISVAGAPISPGDVKHYQCWYRDILPFCTPATYNTSNGVTLVWN